jgi:hypothetical protein
MRRKNQGSRITRQCIVWAMTAMLVAGSVAPSQTVYAVESYSQCEEHTGDGAPDSAAGQYNDDEAAKNAASQTSVQDMQKQVDAAQAAATDADAAVKAAQTAVDAAVAATGTSEVKDANGTVTTPASGAEGAADAAVTAAGTAEVKDANGTVTTPATGAEGAAETAKAAVDALNADTAKEVTDYNNKVASDQTAVDARTAAAADITKVTVTDESGKQTTAEVTDYVKDQAAIAKQAAADAKTALEAALAVDTTDAKNQEVQDNVQKVNDAAADAKAAAKAASDAVDEANANLLASVKAYNEYAYAYGLPAYTGSDGKTYTVKDANGNVVTPGYSEAEMKAAGVTAQDPSKAAIQQDIDAINSADISAQKDVIDKAQASVDTAVTAQTEAEKAADTADKAVTEMNTKLGDGTTAGDVKTAEDAAGKVNNYYVDPAQAAYDKSVADANSKQTELTAAQQAAQKAADELARKEKEQADAADTSRENGEKAYTGKLNELSNNLTSAQNERNSITLAQYTKVINSWGWTWTDYAGYGIACIVADSKVTSAQEAKTEFEKKHDSYVSNYVLNDQNVINASNAVDAAANSKKAADSTVTDKQQALDTANAQAASDQAVLTAAQIVRDNYVKETTEAYQQNAISNLEEKINGILSNYSGDINQVEYDKDANHWGNNLTGYSTKVISDADKNIAIAKAKYELRKSLDDKYKDKDPSFLDNLESFINKPPILQLLLDTTKQDQFMAQLTAAYESELTTYNEEMKTVQVNAARLSTEDSLKAAQAVAGKEQDNLTKIADINTKVTAAQDNLKDAQDTYTAANDKLTALRASVKDAKLNGIQLANLQKAIAAAQKKVNEAGNTLNKATAAANSAQNYANWANALVTQQVTQAFGQAAVNADGKKVDKNGNVAKDKSEYTTATVNVKDYDRTEVISRPAIDFTYNLNTVTVPYSIYRAYVKKMCDISNYSEVIGKSNKMSGKGVMTTDTMPVVYWAVDADGKLTGTNYLSTDEMPSGTYFVGYTFKHESDGYHIDGTQVTYTRPAVPTPEVTPEPANNNGGSSVVTISAEATPLAATPAVLGVNRAAATTEPAVLGANRAAADNGKAVLGARRDVNTGDASNAAGWLALMAAATGAGAAYVLIRRKDRKEEQ